MNKEFVLSLISNKRSARSLQKSVGPSEIGGCSRQVWHRLNATPITNTETLELAAWMGTAMHADLERRVQLHDPFRERFMTEMSVTADGITGHIDLYDSWENEVVDWKTTTKSKLNSKRYPWPSDQQRTQVHLYGYLLTRKDFPVDTVTLVGFPRDGNENHLTLHSEPYDPAIAQAGIDWLRKVEASENAPDPERPLTFCKDYCQFYDASGLIGCPGGIGGGNDDL